MAKQVKVRYVYNAGALECRDITVGCVYDAELLSFGEVDKDGTEVQCYDKLWITEDDAGDAVVTHLSAGFELVEEQDDPLPPAPESVRYNDEYPNRSAYKQTWLDVKQDDNQVYIETGQYGESKGVGMVLSADAALQLAHDLTRMAMEIKRKEKQQQRKTTLSPAIVHPYGE